MAKPKHYLTGKRVHLAGSISPTTHTSLAKYAHELIRGITLGILEAGGGLVLGVGKEPRADEEEITSPSLTFDWTVLEVLAAFLEKGSPRWPRVSEAPLVIVTSEKSISEIPINRKELWGELVTSDMLRLEYIMLGARSASMIRDKQARFGDLLVTLGGGTGVEHLAQLYLKQRRPVVPLDLKLGASRSDGNGGSELMAREALADPKRFIRLRTGQTETAGAYLAGLATQNGTTDTKDLTRKIIALLENLSPQRAFYTRLLDRRCADFVDVEAFFRNVVDQVVGDAGYERYEMATDPPEHSFMNVEIFEGVHFSPVVIADLTGLRPNCLIELGYALANDNKVIISAREGTKLPFDTESVPCHFWSTTASDEDRRVALVEFWKTNINRPSLVIS